MPRATTFKEDMDFAKRLAEEFMDCDPDLEDIISEDIISVMCDSITADFVLSWVVKNFDPGDVYDGYDLIRWAQDNDFVRKDEDE